MCNAQVSFEVQAVLAAVVAVSTSRARDRQRARAGAVDALFRRRHGHSAVGTERSSSRSRTAAQPATLRENSAGVPCNFFYLLQTNHLLWFQR
jgi:hypothetical protein